MPKRKIQHVSNTYIPDIYNFCDNWCGKCPHTSQCLRFVLNQKAEKKLSALSDNTFVYELKGKTIEAPYDFEVFDDHTLYEEDLAGNLAFERSESSDVMRLFLIYENLLDKYLERISTRLGKVPKDELFLIEEAVTSINWYINVIYTKLVRALYFQINLKKKKEVEANGAAKVALVGIDKSIDAWLRVKPTYPSQYIEVEHILTVLYQMRREIIKVFKGAESFRRPGFDE